MQHRFKRLVNLLMQSDSSKASAGNIDEEIRFAVSADMVAEGATRLNPNEWNRVLRNAKRAEWADATRMMLERQESDNGSFEKYLRAHVVRNPIL